MKRRFNFTGRRRIEQANATIRVDGDESGGEVTFEVDLDFRDLALPQDALVTIEAFRGARIQRFPWGTFGHLTPPQDRRLIDMGGNPNFRIKAVAADGSGRLLALAQRLRPHREKKRGSLVWLEGSNNLGKEVWRVDFGEGNPTLLLNNAVQGIMGAARNDHAFQSLVFPEVLRAILTQAITVDGADFDGADPDDESERWMRLGKFVHSFYHETLPAVTNGDGGYERPAEEVKHWIDDAVKAFTQNNFPASDFYAETLER